MEKLDFFAWEIFQRVGTNGLILQLESQYSEGKNALKANGKDYRRTS